MNSVYLYFICNKKLIYFVILKGKNIYKLDNLSWTFVSIEQPSQPPEPFASFVINVLFFS